MSCQETSIKSVLIFQEAFPSDRDVTHKELNDEITSSNDK